MPSLFILMGLPGAGKSTFSNVITTIKNNVIYISSDELRKEFPEYQDNHIKIFEIMYQRTIENLRDNKNVIYDSTNLESKYRLELYKKTKNISSEIKVINVFIHNGLENAIKQSEQRKNRNDVSEKLIRNMYATMEIPKAGIDCDIIMVPKIKKENDQFMLYSSKFYNANEMKEFYDYIKTIDMNLINKMQGRKKINEKNSSGCRYPCK